jgi:hypothetical protein
MKRAPEMSAVRFGRTQLWLGYLLAFAFGFGLALGGIIIANFPTAPGSSGLRYVQSGVSSDRPRFAFATDPGGAAPTPSHHPLPYTR